MVGRRISSSGDARCVAGARRVDLGDAVGREPARRQGVDADRGDLVDEALDQPGEPRAERVRRREPGDRLADRAREDDQDRRVAALARCRQRRADQPDRAPQRAVDAASPGRLVEVREPARRRAAGVDDQEVEAAQRGHGAGHRGGRAVRRGEVGGDGHGIEARRGLGQARALAGDERHRRALGAQDRGDRAAEAATAPAHEGSMSGQSEVHTRFMVRGEAACPPAWLAGPSGTNRRTVTANHHDGRGRLRDLEDVAPRRPVGGVRRRVPAPA